MKVTKQSLTLRIQRIKDELMEVGDLRPGSLSEQYNVCGTAGCRCKADPPQKHGPYYQLSYAWKGRSKTKFVPRTRVSEVKRQLKNYKRLRELVDKWVELELQRCELMLTQGD
jgi:hypothetical protein